MSQPNNPIWSVLCLNYHQPEYGFWRAADATIRNVMGDAFLNILDPQDLHDETRHPPIAMTPLAQCVSERRLVVSPPCIYSPIVVDGACVRVLFVRPEQGAESDGPHSLLVEVTRALEVMATLQNTASTLKTLLPTLTAIQRHSTLLGTLAAYRHDVRGSIDTLLTQAFILGRLDEYVVPRKLPIFLEEVHEIEQIAIELGEKMDQLKAQASPEPIAEWRMISEIWGNICNLVEFRKTRLNATLEYQGAGKARIRDSRGLRNILFQLALNSLDAFSVRDPSNRIELIVNRTLKGGVILNYSDNAGGFDPGFLSARHHETAQVGLPRGIFAIGPRGPRIASHWESSSGTDRQSMGLYVAMMSARSMKSTLELRYSTQLGSGFRLAIPPREVGWDDETT